MVSSEHSVDELIEFVEELQERVATLKDENERLRNENEQLRETVEEQAETIAKLTARLKRYENAHTPPRKQRSATSGGDGDGDDEPEESSSDTDTADGDDEARTDYSRFADEVAAMAIIRAIDPQPLRLHPDRWVKLYLSQDFDVGVSPNHLSDVLEAIGQGKGWWHDFFTDLIGDREFLLYDLPTVFSRSQNIKRAEKGYNPDQLYLDQLGVILVFSTATDLPAGVDVFWGSMKDITTFKEFLAMLDPADFGFIVDRGLFIQTSSRTSGPRTSTTSSRCARTAGSSISGGCTGSRRSFSGTAPSGGRAATPISGRSPCSMTPSYGPTSAGR